ncbi:class I SAM-dependent RNA methyltransferase [Cellulomonas shaoxiangyii]|uniref:Class I SAM-dependent RNA methyltransferase n=1 Tax=Cellulomonas shaoxiangyii TaxID=2566013 RepID=A0A4V1CMQ8_9CELL|nr:TRAM domain-containing protein [Cellulomonas shaoxiangyii]QCB93795.1 class I SAM-dependent RNA methyltransferase [Cellulomonas shaoxiangyii]TGY84918.1 class I SAM-dependent RNA methyltransferase [Cellulomonas shaoxiangyii]
MSSDITPATGDVVELEVGPVAHGGHCVARYEGRVVFVRHTLPGERVRARLTDAGETAKFWRADAVEVLEASPDRVPSAWPEAGPGGVGGGELAHVALPAQRAWKATVLAEQLQRLARLDLTPEVLAAPGDDGRGGLGWRTRIELVADASGRAGMRRHRSHDVVPLTSMPLASDDIAALDLFSARWPAGSRIEAVAPADGSSALVLVDGAPFDRQRGRPDTRPNARAAVREQVLLDDRRYEYRVAGAGFWQVHREGPALLVREVLRGVGDVEGATVLDLYSGAGLFSLPLADAVGGSGRVVGVEGDARAVRDARRNAHDRPQVELHAGDVADALRGRGGAPVAARADVVVLDPPRTGAGRGVVDAVAALRPERIVYVACDPAALARDVALFAAHGWTGLEVTGYDLFPHTHHLEAVAVLTR